MTAEKSALAPSKFYVTGGTLQRDAPSYVHRHADEELYRSLSAGQFCYVLTSRQMGKSSLMVRTAARLREDGATVAVLDLTALGQNLTPEQWYDGLIGLVGQQFGIEEDLEEFWVKNERLGPLQRWMRAIREVVLKRYTKQVTIFVDEIDAVRSLPFSTDEFFAAIRECYNERPLDPGLKRLTFCLLGVATPSDLIRDTRTTPFNIGERIELTDFTETEALPLAVGLGRGEKLGSALLRQVLYWTGGHPYLTQRLCQAVAEDEQIAGVGDADRVCQGIFLTSRARERDDNLLFVRERLLRSEADLAGLLELYRGVWRRKRVPDDETNPLVSVLRLSGITRVVDGFLQVRNRIYGQVFDPEWVKANMPDAEIRRQREAYSKGLLRAAGIATVVLLAMGSLAIAAVKQRNRALEEKARADQYAQKLQKALNDLRESLTETEKERAVADEQRQQAIEQKQLAEHQQLEAQKQKKIADERSQEAEEQKTLAEQQRAYADRQRLAAVEQKKFAEEEGQKNRRLLYASQMKLAQQAWETANVEVMQDLLENARSKTGEEDLRGFEWYYLLHLIHRDKFTFQRGTGTIEESDIRAIRNAMSFLPDGLTLAAVDSRGALKHWNVIKGKELNTFKAADQRLTWSIVSSDKKRMGRLYQSSAQEGLLTVEDLVTGQELFTHKFTMPIFSTMTCSPDGRIFALLPAGDFQQSPNNELNRRVRLINVDSGKEITLPKGFNGHEESAAFSPDSKRLATANDNGEVMLWDVFTGQELSIMKAHTKFYNRTRVLFSPDGRSIVVAAEGINNSGSPNSLVKLWDVATGYELVTFNPGINIYDVAFSPSGRLLAISGTRNDFNSVVQNNIEEEPVVDIWDVLIAKKTASLNGHKDFIRAIKFSHNGSRLATGSVDRTIKLWNVNTGKEIDTLKGHAAEIISLSFSPDDNLLASMSADENIKLWDLVSVDIELDKLKTDPISFYQGSRISAAIFSPDSRMLAESDGIFVRLSDVVSGEQITSLKIVNILPKGNSAGADILAFSPDGKHLAAGGADGSVKLWDISTLKEVVCLSSLGSTEGYSPPVAFSPDGKLLVTGVGDKNGVLKVWDAITGRELNSFNVTGGAISRLAFFPDGRRLAVAAAVENITVLDIPTGSLLLTLKGPARDWMHMAVSPDGRLIATTEGTAVKVWNADTGKELISLRGHKEKVTAIAFSPDGKKLVTGSDDKTVRIWDLVDKTELISFKQFTTSITSIRFSPNGKSLAVISYSGVQLLRTESLETSHPNYRVALQRTMIGRDLFNQRKYAEAEAEYREALRQVQGYAGFYGDLGIILLAQNKYTEAEVQYREAIRREPNIAQWHNDLAIALERQNNLAEAEAEQREAARLEPKNALSYIELGKILGMQKRWAEAEAQFKKALQLAPNNPEALNDIGYFLIENDRNLDEALQMTRQAVNAEPTNSTYLDSLGWAYFKLGKFDEAERYLLESIHFNPSATQHEHLGDTHFRRGKKDLARDEWKLALSLTSDAETVKRLQMKLEGEVKK